MYLKRWQHPLVQQVVLLLDYIAAEQDSPGGGDELLFELLHAPGWGIPAADIAALSLEVFGRHSGVKKTSIRRLLAEKIRQPAADLFTPTLHEGLATAGRLSEQWINDLKRPSVTTVLQTLAGGGEWQLQQPAAQGHRLLPIQKERPEIEKLPAVLAGPLVARFTMNVTALSNYLHCPLEFYYKNILRIPSPKSEAAGFGSAVHYALEQLFRNMLARPGSGRQRSFDPPEMLIRDFERDLLQRREGFTQAQYERRLAHGREVLANYYATYSHRFPTIVAIERMMHVDYHGIPLKGKLDKLEFDGNTVNIVDYKTGDPDKAITRMQPPNEQHPNGGDYWRQAVFYKLLVDHYTQKDWKASSVEFDFIEPDKKGQYRREKLAITAADATTVGQQIISVWEKVQQHDFYTGCGKTGCHWCHFVKMHGRAVNEL